LPWSLRVPLRLAALMATSAIASPAFGDTATGDPSTNLTLSQNTVQACQSSPSSADCVSDALADINGAHAAEGVEAMALPSDWGQLTVSQQLLVVSNLERTERGLIPALGLSAPLDADAAKAASNDEDPMPTNFYGDYATSNWEGGYPSALEADFVWMYDDGYGSVNEDCTSPGASGCWGHRQDILAAFDAPLVMGAAGGTGAYGASLTELFVGGDQETGAGQPDAPLNPTWATISAFLPDSTSSDAGRRSTGTRPATSAKKAKISFWTIRGQHTLRILGRVTPAQPDRLVELDLRRGGRWVRLGATRLGRGGRFSLRVPSDSARPWRLRVVLPPVADAGPR
jgi:hypothetical protein